MAELPGDLSTRRYLRFGTPSGGTLLVAVYPAAAVEAQRRFARAAALLAGAGVRVPSILANDPERGWMALEDLGERTVHELASRGWPGLLPYFRDAIVQLHRIAALPARDVAALGSPPLDAELLARELGAAFTHLLDPAGLADQAALREELRTSLDALCGQLAADGAVPCHRDFMARNLVALPGGRVGVIDFQDLRLGPPSYDTASLLNDSLFPEPEIEQDLRALALPPGVAIEQYRRAVVQRCLKAAGTFARCASEGRPERLALIAPTMARAASHLERLPETERIYAALREWWGARWSATALC